MLYPVVIQADAIYDDSALYQALGLPSAALAAARRAGSLRFARRGRRVFYLGAWVPAWLKDQADSNHTAARAQEPRNDRRPAALQPAVPVEGVAP
jgi:hypothetical protein